MRHLNPLLTIISAIGTGLFLSSSSLHAEPVSYSPRLTEWLFLTSPEGAHLPAQRYADFLKMTPQWPLRTRMTWRYEKALQQEADPTTLKQLCPLFPLTQLVTLQICSSYLTNSSEQARLLWRNGLADAADERSFLSFYGKTLRPDDQWARYQTLENKGLKQAAFRQISRLSASKAALARVRFAQRFALPTADELFDSQQSITHDDTLIRLRLHLLRQQNRLEEGYTLWQAQQPLQGPQPAQTATEILSYVRLFLRSGLDNDNQKALDFLTSLSQQPPGFQRNDALFLNGYTQLFRFNHIQQAKAFFRTLSQDSSLIYRAEGFYWLGRCAEAANEAEEAQSWFRQAASYPTVFYGQMALARLTQSPFLNYANRTRLFKSSLQSQLSHLPRLQGGPIPRTDLVEAIQALAGNNDLTNAAIFISYLYVHTNESSALISVAQLSSQLNFPKGAILSARKLARSAIALYPLGYPLPYDPAALSNIPPSLPPSLVPALIRQESSGDPNAISPSPAYGLMQLRLPTAQMVARKHHLETVTANTLLDPQTNIVLGTQYLSSIIERFQGSLPYALAAYNAGPARVVPIDATPLSTENDDDILKWIVLFPFKETRGYIENIMGDMAIYTSITQ